MWVSARPLRTAGAPDRRTPRGGLGWESPLCLLGQGPEAKFTISERFKIYYVNQRNREFENAGNKTFLTFPSKHA